LKSKQLQGKLILWAQIWSLKNPLTLRSDSEDGFILNERGLAHLPVRTQNLANLADINSKLGESCRYELKLGKSCRYEHTNGDLAGVNSDHQL
jgi:hypothetical protein